MKALRIFFMFAKSRFNKISPGKKKFLLVNLNENKEYKFTGKKNYKFFLFFKVMILF